MEPPSYMRSIVDRNVVMRRIPVYKLQPQYTYVLSMNIGDTKKKSIENGSSIKNITCQETTTFNW